MYTHDYSDQTSGIFEMRPFFWKIKREFQYMEAKEPLHH